jgi:hypothetical protein
LDKEVKKNYQQNGQSRVAVLLIIVSSPNVRVVFVNEKTPARKFGRLRYSKGLKNTFYPGFWRGYELFM